MKLSGVLLQSHGAWLELDVVLPRLHVLRLKRSGVLLRLHAARLGFDDLAVATPAERAKAEQRGRLFRHFQYYERGCSRKAPHSAAISNCDFCKASKCALIHKRSFYWLPVSCNYPSAVLYRLSESL